MLNRVVVFLYLILLSITFGNKETFTLASKTENQIFIDFKLEDYSIKKINGKNHIFLDKDNLTDDNFSFNTFIQIDLDQQYSINSEEDSIASYDFEDNTYSTNISESYYNIKEHIIRGRKLVEIIVNPFRIDNNLAKLDVISEISINIELIDYYKNYNNESRRYSQSFDKIINNISLNEIDLNRDWQYQTPSVLYVCDPDIESNPHIQALVNWRKQQGYEATLVTTNDTGNSTSSIKSFIEEAYFTWDNPPEFLCLVGDANGSISVPTYDVVQEGGGGWDLAHGESDFPYTLIEGGSDDIFPEMFVGRISVRSNSELATVVNKIIGYEKAYAGTEDWLTTTALVGDPYDSGISTVISNQYIEQLMDNYGVENINTQYSGSNFDTFMRNQINSGVSFLNYRGFYGFSNFNQNDISQLNNGYKLPFISTLTCGVNSFSSDNESIVEALLRAGSVSNPSGAVAVVGTSESYTHTAFNNIVSMGIFEGIYLHNAYTAGEALVYGKIALMNTYPQNPNGNVTLFSSWNNLMGDPLTHLWTNTPIVLSSEHHSIISSSTNYFEVFVLDDEGRPISNAIVTLYKNDEHFITSTTNTFGKAYFNLDFNQIGNVLVTSRCHNCVPCETSFEISNDIPNIVLVENSLDVIDNENGNSDGFANPGETILLNFNIENLSEDIMEDCVIEVNSNYSEIQVINDSYSIDTLSSNSIVNISDILIDVDNIVGYLGNVFFLNASLNCQDLSWDFILPININYGDISVNLDLLSDQNNNMILDPGETGEFRVIVNNNGYLDLDVFNASFNNGNEQIQIENSQIFLETLNINDYNDTNTITIVASNNLINGTIVTIPVNCNSDNGYESTLYTNIQIGNTTTSDPLGPDLYGYYIYDFSDIEYQWAPNYEWIEIDPDYGGDGSELSIYDSGNNQDDAQILDLPFTFTFYGIDYNTITICSNGWISFGETDMVSFRNYNLPGPGGPSPMIAGFWDDLKTSSGPNGGEIYYYYDSFEDHLIIEWSNMSTYINNDLETFQMILYNSDDLTPTGDDEIKIQYKDFNNTSEGYYPVGNYDGAVIHGQYCTIGIENMYGNVGLEYTFNDEYSVAAETLNDETAIFITTRTPLIFSEPSLYLSENSYYVDLDSGETENLNLTISNNGQEGSILNYNLVLSPFNDINSIVDSGGYAWISSLDENNGTQYTWENISEDAISLFFNHNDEATNFLDIGFPFPFYDNQYTQCIVNPNGWIGFSEDFNGWNNQDLLSEDSPKNAILGFWDDLNPEVSQDNDIGLGNVFIDSQADKCIIWYDNVVHWTSLDRVYDFQIVLYPDGTINLNYREMIGDTDSATIGIINDDGEITNQVVYNNEFIENESSILFKGKPIWLNYYQNDFNDTSLGYNESNQYSINIDTGNLFLGEYSAAFIVNPENLFPQIVPIYLNVLESDLIPGDVNFDNELNVLDIVNIMGYIIQSTQPTSEQFDAADINQDNVLDILDIVTIVNIILDE